MKKRLMIFTAIIASIALATAAFANEFTQLTAYVARFSIFVNGEERSFYNPIVTINDRTYIPLGEVGEALGMNVEWDEENQQINISSTQSSNEDGGTLYPFEQNGLWGYRDASGNIIIEPQYSFANEFSEGLAFVTGTPEQRGYIDLTGHLVIPLPESATYPHGFSEGFALIIHREWDHDNEEVHVIGTRGPFIFIDRLGQNVFDQEFAYAHDFDGGFAIVRLMNGNNAFIDITGQNAFGQEFKSISQWNRHEDFPEGGVSSVRLLNGNWAYIDRTGQNFFGKEFVRIGDFFNWDYVAFTLPDGTSGYMDRLGNVYDSRPEGGMEPQFNN